MNVQARPRVATMERRLPFECVALVLQGGGALGAYQAGVYEALAEASIHPDWVAGISIGAINSALIAGNPPERRVDRLRAFWEGITTGFTWFDWARVPKGDAVRKLLNQLYAGWALVAGAPGLFAPRYPPPWLYPPGNANATSLYATSRLRVTLERLVDFDRLNADLTRLSIGAVNVRSGYFIYFDTQTHTIGPEHIMASGALPPGFPPVEIEGEHYWDGGLVSNTPLQWVIETQPRLDTLAFQVDVRSARGEPPRSLAEVSTLQYSIPPAPEPTRSDVYSDFAASPPICLISCRKSSAAVRRPRCSGRRLIASSISSTAPRVMRGPRRITSFRVGVWKTTGVPGITTWSAHCAIPESLSGRPIMKASLLSASPQTDVRRELCNP
jgi:predicted acylesterase/phospholipase RssA